MVALLGGELGVVRVATPVDLADELRTEPQHDLAAVVGERERQHAAGDVAECSAVAHPIDVRIDGGAGRPVRRSAARSPSSGHRAEAASSPSRIDDGAGGVGRGRARRPASAAARRRRSSLVATWIASATRRPGDETSSVRRAGVGVLASRRCAGRSAGRGTRPRCGRRRPGGAGPSSGGRRSGPTARPGRRSTPTSTRVDAHVGEVLDVDRRHAAQRRRAEVERAAAVEGRPAGPAAPARSRCRGSAAASCAGTARGPGPGCRSPGSAGRGTC